MSLFVLFSAPDEKDIAFCFFSKRTLLILIHPLTPFHQRLQLLKHLYPLRLHSSSIDNLSLVLAPIHEGSYSSIYFEGLRWLFLIKATTSSYFACHFSSCVILFCPPSPISATWVTPTNPHATHP